MPLHRLFALLLICLLPLAPLWAAPMAMPAAVQQPAAQLAAADDTHCMEHEAAAVPPAGEHCSTDCILHCALPGQGIVLAAPVWIATALPAPAGRHYSNPDPILPLRPPAA
ncbi:hypothetical protein SAMN02745857_00238 [Andreprevotia lacus DSM 23236]|jgi:hypothetical protein|uniref:DUF2946 domain-containing protein n=1 Tax=Andreprevotia lacus DSM 23236 TaxID=1121001 RepID=A0A1W1WZ19_9NEIS|nr:hypothetical protein [Andreprevotia lacus]SMC16688.1 hypothetical protein SAMN02745857_00238 [Andreprevotia lacus DSM 23236]